MTPSLLWSWCASPLTTTDGEVGGLLSCCLTCTPAACGCGWTQAGADVACRYDKQKILQKEITNVQYVACMNPTAGSFYITPRMQRHFATFAIQMPGPEIVR